MKKQPKLHLLVIILFLAALWSCQKEITISPEDGPVLRILSENEQTLKENLEVTSVIIREMILEDQSTIKDLNNLLSESDYEDGLVFFKDIFGVDSKSGLKNHPKFVKGFYNVVNRKNINAPDNLEEFLSVNGINLYCPYPLEDYPVERRTPTITSHPVDNVTQNEGFEINLNGSFREVLVNEEYSEEYPIWIIMPFPNDIDLDKKYKPIKGETANAFSIDEIKIGEIFCTNYCEELFEGGLEIRILRSKTSEVLDGTNWRVEGGFSTAIPFHLDRRFVRYAKNEWQAGWFPVNVPWDTNWDTTKVQQVIAVYEEDKKGTIEINGSAKLITKYAIKYKDPDGNEISAEAGAELSVGCKATFESKNDLLGVNEWNRKWFLLTNTCGSGNYYGGSDTRNGWTIRSVSPQFWFTSPYKKY